MRAFSALLQRLNAAGTGLAACGWHRKLPAGPGCSVLDVGLKARRKGSGRKASIRSGPGFVRIRVGCRKRPETSMMTAIDSDCFIDYD